MVNWGGSSTVEVSAPAQDVAMLDSSCWDNILDDCMFLAWQQRVFTLIDVLDGILVSQIVFSRFR